MSGSSTGEPDVDPRGAGRKSRADFPPNARGETFGSGLDARTSADRPDLVVSYGTRGEIGYVRRTDMDGEQPRTPAEAIALTQRRAAGPTPIPLYADDGETVIGTFLLG